MDTTELITYIGLVAVLVTALGLTVFLFYRQKFIGHNKLKREAPLVKGRASIHVPGLGWCESVGDDRTGDNSAILHLQDTYGNTYQEGPVYQDELIPLDVFQNINGPGNQMWKYVPPKDRRIAALGMEQQNNHLRQQAALSKESAEQASAYAKQASVNIEQEVQRRIEHAAIPIRKVREFIQSFLR